MIYTCPGQDKRNLKIEARKCHACGYNLEMFSDEIKTQCPQCNSLAYREKLPSCLDWCRAAGECLGRKHAGS